MSGIHLVYLCQMNITRNCYCISLDFWIECLINSVGSILIPNNIKYPKRTKDGINQRYHERTSCRYLAMHLVFLLENIVLITFSFFTPALNLNPFSKYSKLLNVIEDPKDNYFIKLFPLWTLGLFFLALGLKFLYYQSHAWPIDPNCFQMTFLCPIVSNEEEFEIDEPEEHKDGMFISMIIKISLLIIPWIKFWWNSWYFKFVLQKQKNWKETKQPKILVSQRYKITSLILWFVQKKGSSSRKVWYQKNQVFFYSFIVLQT